MRPIKAQPNPVIFFPNSQTDVDLLTRDVQRAKLTETKHKVDPRENQSLYILLANSSLLISRKPWLASSVSLSTISRTFHSLFRVLFIFPSRYLFAIGLSPIFSFRWNLPPILSCNPKQLDSLKRGPLVRSREWTIDGIVTLYDISFQRICIQTTSLSHPFLKLQFDQECYSW